MKSILAHFTDRKEFITLLKFGLVGVSNTLISYSFFILFVKLGIIYWLSNILCYFAGLINSFLLNKKWTFKSHKKTNFAQLSIFLSVNLLALLLSLLVILILVEKLNINEYVSQLISMIFSMIVNYVGNKLYVFNE